MSLIDWKSTALISIIKPGGIYPTSAKRLACPCLTASSQEWTLLGPALAEQGWYAIAPDLRGRGLSRETAAWLRYSLSRQRSALTL